MPYASPEKRRAADRERRRRQRAKAVELAMEGAVEGTEKNLSAPLPPRPTVAELTSAVAEEINRVRAANTETLARARTVGYLAGVLLKSLEVGEIERRLDELEKAVGQEKEL